MCGASTGFASYIARSFRTSRRAGARYNLRQNGSKSRYAPCAEVALPAVCRNHVPEAMQNERWNPTALCHGREPASTNFTAPSPSPNGAAFYEPGVTSQNQL